MKRREAPLQHDVTLENNGNSKDAMKQTQLFSRPPATRPPVISASCISHPRDGTPDNRDDTIGQAPDIKVPPMPSQDLVFPLRSSVEVLCKVSAGGKACLVAGSNVLGLVVVSFRGKTSRQKKKLCRKFFFF